MSNYTVRAFNGKKSVVIPIEEKHLYINKAPQVITLNRWNSADGNPDKSSGYCPNADTIPFAYVPLQSTFTRGTGSSSTQQFIGNKIALKSLQYSLKFRLDDYNLVSVRPPGYSPAYYNIRLMAVQFEDIDDSDPAAELAYLTDWLKELWVYDSLRQVASGKSDPIVSSHAKMLKESTKYTGTFRIVRDYPFTLNDRDKQSHVINDTIDFRNKQCTLKNVDATRFQISDTEFTKLYFILILPINYYMDMDPISRSRFENQNNVTVQTDFLDHSGFFKITYFDL